MAAVNPGERFAIGGQTVLLLALYLFLYFPIFYIGYLSVVDNSVWPFPPVFTGEWYGRLMIMSDFHTGLLNSVFIGAGTAVLSTLFATTAAIGISPLSAAPPRPDSRPVSRAALRRPDP